MAFLDAILVLLCNRPSVSRLLRLTELGAKESQPFSHLTRRYCILRKFHTLSDLGFSTLDPRTVI